MSGRDEIKQLREEIVKLRERVAVLEAQRNPTPYYVPYFYEPYRWIGPQWSYTTSGTLTALAAHGDVSTGTVTVSPWST